MDFVQKIYDFILYLVNTIKGLVAALKGEEEETTIKTDETTTA